MWKRNLRWSYRERDKIRRSIILCHTQSIKNHHSPCKTIKKWAPLKNSNLAWKYITSELSIIKSILLIRKKKNELIDVWEFFYWKKFQKIQKSKNLKQYDSCLKITVVTFHWNRLNASKLQARRKDACWERGKSLDMQNVSTEAQFLRTVRWFSFGS